MPCQFCGAYHQSVVGPPKITFEEPNQPVATLNGLSFGEQLIADKLDEIISLLHVLKIQGRKI